MQTRHRNSHKLNRGPYCFEVTAQSADTLSPSVRALQTVNCGVDSPSSFQLKLQELKTDFDEPARRTTTKMQKCLERRSVGVGLDFVDNCNRCLVAVFLSCRRGTACGGNQEPYPQERTSRRAG